MPIDDASIHQLQEECELAKREVRFLRHRLLNIEAHLSVDVEQEPFHKTYDGLLSLVHDTYVRVQTALERTDPERVDKSDQLE